MPSSHIRYNLLGLPVDALTMATAVERVSEQIERARQIRLLAAERATPTPADSLQSVDESNGQSVAGSLWQVVTLNPEMVMQARRDPQFQALIQAAPMVTVDGIGIVWALRWRGVRLPGRVTGVDLLEALAAHAAMAGWRLFLLGAAPRVAALAEQTLQRRYPGLQIVGAWVGTPDPSGDPETLKRLFEAQPDILFVAYGSPTQECWIARISRALADSHDTTLAGMVAIGVGGAFDVLAGRLPRAPRWLRAIGLEWLFRLARQPWRWRRMLALPRFALAALREGQRV
jgi:N-acetylglucosaminyldiphosphoundecaprenol N-acetyl-beta-D-mannosaminyltransferase